MMAAMVHLLVAQEQMAKVEELVAMVVTVVLSLVAAAMAAMAAQEVRVATEVWAELVRPDLTVKHRANQTSQVDKVVTAAPVASVEQVD